MHAAARRFVFGKRHGLAQDLSDVEPLHLQPERPDELEHLDDDRIGQLRLADDVGEERLGIGRLADLPLQKASHDLDAGERVLQLVRDTGGHFPERGEAIPQPLPLLLLLDLRQIFEERTAPMALSLSSLTTDSV